MLSKLLPEYSKVVYIDLDTILLRDIADLFDHDIHDVYAGVVLDYTYKFILRSDMRVPPQFGGTTVKEYWSKYLQLSESAMAKYFNSGVMVFNLDKIRNDELLQVIERLYHEKPYYCVDQDILNKAFDGCVLHVDPRWNVITQPLNEMKRCPYHFYKEYEATRNDPYVLHYAGGHLKPWNNPKMDFAEFFWHYCRKTPFYEAILYDTIKGVRPNINLNGQSLTHYAKALKATVGATLHKVSPSLHAHCSRFYHKIRG
jgi:lipopolysaccharide biosynthesis glycosyltransferase